MNKFGFSFFWGFQIWLFKLEGWGDCGGGGGGGVGVGVGVLWGEEAG